MSLSPQPKLKFLLDENVHSRLGIFLKTERLDVAFSPKGTLNGNSVILLRISQNKPESLLKAFSDLLKEKTSHADFEGKLIILEEEGFKAIEP